MLQQIDMTKKMSKKRVQIQNGNADTGNVQAAAGM